MTDAFWAATYGAFQLGFDSHTPIPIVHVQNGFTDPACAIGTSLKIQAAQVRTAALRTHDWHCSIPTPSRPTDLDAFSSGCRMIAVENFYADPRQTERTTNVKDVERRRPSCRR